MSQLRPTFVALVALSLAGCGSEAPSPTTVPDALLSTGGVLAKASGAGHRSDQGLPIAFNFSATLHADGRTTGSYYYRAVASGLWISVDVTCMSTAGDNQAFVGGIVKDSSVPSFIGTVSYFYAIDNGEGADAGPDIVSLVKVRDPAGEDELFCREQPTLLPPREVIHGNVNVRVNQ